MKRVILLSVVVLFCAAVAFAGTAGKMDLKVGDEVYACNCGEKCPCMTMSRNPGKCTCGNEMVKAKVMKVEDDKVMLKSDSWDKERPFKTTGKYTCDCGPECKCNTISQNPGKCSCGMDLKKVAGTAGKMDLKVGDEVYACNCGEKCPCMTMSRNPGKCTCGNEMVKAKVMKVEDDMVMLKSDSWDKERPFKTTGKYTCDCGPDCKCNTISQNPGKCACGKDMKKL